MANIIHLRHLLQLGFSILEPLLVPHLSELLSLLFERLGLLEPRVVRVEAGSLEVVDQVVVHLRLEHAVDARLGLGDEVPLLDERQQVLGLLVDAIGDAGGNGLGGGEPTGLEDEVAVREGGHLRAEEGRHGGLQRRAEEQLVDAEEATRRGRQAVVLGRGEHEATSKGVTVDESNGGHGVAADWCKSREIKQGHADVP